jgi:hypothetical protein
MKVSSVILTLILTTGLTMSALHGSEDLDTVISYLLDCVQKADVIFIRNGKQHQPEAAARHMERKLDHFRDEIETPEDFIRLTATKSMVSGKPYLVRFPNGEEIQTKIWLTKVLERYRSGHSKVNDPR